MILREAFEDVIKVLGPNGTDLIISQIRSRCDYNQQYLEINIVIQCFERIFGPALAALLIQRIKITERNLNLPRRPNATTTAKA